MSHVSDAQDEGNTAIGNNARDVRIQILEPLERLGARASGIVPLHSHLQEVGDTIVLWQERNTDRSWFGSVESKDATVADLDMAVSLIQQKTAEDTRIHRFLRTSTLPTRSR